jgi:hypothetical protein
MPGQHDDQTLLLADVARKALHQVQVLLERMLEERYGSRACARGR